MCYAIPGRVEKIDGKVVVVDYFGEKRNCINEFVDAKIGDYVYAQGGIVVQKVPKEEAGKVLSEWKELFFRLKEKDQKLSNRITLKKDEIGSILSKAKEGKDLQKAELLKLFSIEKDDDLKALFDVSNKIRQDKLKNSCCVHGIIEFSNICANNCMYCGLRKDNKKLKRYRMGADEIIETAKDAVRRLGFKALVLQSGENDEYSTEELVGIIKAIMKECGVLIFVSVGQRDIECYRQMYDAGARGVLMRFETSNKELYDKIHSGRKADFDERIMILKEAYRMGYMIITGSLVGLPGQSKEDLLDDLLLTKELNAEMWSFGPLIPNPQTPFANVQRIKAKEMLKVIAVSRLIYPDAKILVTTALETLDSDCRKEGLLAGANSLMINLTPKRYKDLYQIYPDRASIADDVEGSIKKTLELLYSIGRAPTDLGRT